MMRSSPDAVRGFSLIELVVVIAIAAILAAVAASRIDVRGFNTEGYANRVAAAVRYAQKTAISQHRNVAVSISGNAVALTYPDAPLNGAPLRQPPGDDDFTEVAPSNVTVAGTSFVFSPLGRPSVGSTITITGDVVRSVIVEAETGYVRYVP